MRNVALANGPQDYRDPKVTTTGRGGSMNWLWYVLGALLLLLLLAWLLGLFSANDEAATATETTDEVVVTEEPATGDAATEDAATGGATTGGATTGGAATEGAAD